MKPTSMVTLLLYVTKRRGFGWHLSLDFVDLMYIKIAYSCSVYSTVVYPIHRSPHYTHTSSMKNLGLAPRTRGRPVKTAMLNTCPIVFPASVPDHAYRWQ